MSLLLTLLFTIVSYNCENLFDCRHDSLKNDYEFLPPASAEANANAGFAAARQICDYFETGSTKFQVNK